MPNNQTIVSLDDVQLPYSLEAEQAVLGSILTEPDCITQVQILLKSDYFYLPQHKAIFNVMQEIDALGGKVDPLVVLEKLKTANVYDDAGGKNYLYQLAQSVPSTQNVESYCNIVKEKYYVRTLINVSKQIIEDASGTDNEADLLLDSAEQKIYDIRQGKVTKGPTKIRDIIINEVYEKLQKLSSADSEQYKGYTTGFTDLDRCMTGLNKSDLIIIGARPAMGKTSLALNMARNVAVKSRKKVLFFSLEMSKEQLAQRIVATEARVPSQKMRTGELTPLGFRQHKEIAGRMYKSFRRVFRGRKMIRANSTQSGRVMLSMESFCQELLGRNPRLEIRMDASERDRAFLASSTPEAIKNAENITWAEDRVRLRDSLIHPERLFRELFSDEAYVSANVDSLEFMTRLFQLASIALDSDTGIRLHEVFTRDELFALWQHHNYIYYATWGPNPLAGEKVLEGAAVATLRQIIERADDAIAKRDCAADLRFSHDSHLVPLSTTLQLDGCRAKVTDPAQVASVWANYRISPMAGNIQLIFYRNRKGEVLVKFMLNEDEVGIPAVTDRYPYYRWEDVKAYYTEYYNL